MYEKNNNKSFILKKDRRCMIVICEHCLNNTNIFNKYWLQQIVLYNLTTIQYISYACSIYHNG